MPHVRVLSLEEVTMLPLDPQERISRESHVLVVLQVPLLVHTTGNVPFLLMYVCM